MMTTLTTERISATTTDRISALRIRILRDPSFGILVLLVVVSVVMAFAEPTFATAGNLTNIINAMITVSFLAIGMTVVLIAGGLDLSVGSVMALTAGVVASCLNNGIPLVVAFLAALGVGAGIGMVNGLLITKLGIPDFIATLAMLGLAGGLLLYWTAGVPVLGYMTDAYYYIGGLRQLIGPITVPMLLVVAVGIAVSVFLRRTTYGVKFYAVGSSATGAMNAGIRVDRIKIAAYVISGLMAAIAGIHIAGRTTTVPPLIGNGYEISAIAAAVIGGASLFGGKGRVIGALVGALTLTLTRNIINLTGVESSWQAVVTGLVLIIAILANQAWSGIARSIGAARR
ncbi:ABC transporter permease [Verrucosispora sp. FIM060022]|uniref:Ribose ABC transporter permease n=2 Tax=unclassified Micromonospora TaxID=2617518 RepID=A0A097CSW5_9ACTN|nr:ribose ABC transporter permease [Verrucosispora sp. MS100047]RUL90306.1 ABC transporter permease [Verrucosispora sp. FIM060022]